MIKFSKLLIIIGFLAITACNDDDPCSNAENVNNPECRRDIPDIDIPKTLEVNFDDSKFFDQNSSTWRTISATNLTGGLMGLTVPVYSSFINIGVPEALTSISIATDQEANPGNYTQAQFNRIPYIQLQQEDGVEYLYFYEKVDLNNNIVKELTGQFLTLNGKAYLPLINAMFGGDFYSANDVDGNRYIHTIKIAAQANNQAGNIASTIIFESVLLLPNTDFTIQYAANVNNFSLKNRWASYFNNIDNVPNQNFNFFKLREIKDVSEQIPLDIRVVFKEPPRLKLTQEVFFEMPLDFDALKVSNTIIPQRGYSFYVQSYEFDSLNDFRMKIRMNNQVQELVSGQEFIVNNLPAGTPWDMDFLYDFSTSTFFPSGSQLLTPLKPVCNEIKGTPFAPITENQQKTNSFNTGGFFAHCHPTTNAKVVLSANDVINTQLELNDTFYDFFSYVPQNDTRNDLGHFLGIRRVRMTSEGCVRVFAKQAGTPTFELKSQGNSACGAGEEGWVYFNAEKTFTIFDSVNDFDGVSGLKNLIQFFGSKPIRQTPFFKFNGNVNDARHIY